MERNELFKLKHVVERYMAENGRGKPLTQEEFVSLGNGAFTRRQLQKLLAGTASLIDVTFYTGLAYAMGITLDELHREVYESTTIPSELD